MNDDLLNKIGEVAKKVFDDYQNLPDQYVVAYRLKSDNSLLGYHASTFCQLVEDKLNGKRYEGDNPYNQLAVINKNVKTILTTKENSHDLFNGLRLNIKNTYFKDLTIDDIYLEADYLDDGVPKQTFNFTIVE